MRFRCAHCGAWAAQATGAVNRARKAGRPLYCNKTCAGLAHRSDKTAAQKREEKRLYDLGRRNGALRETILAKKREYHRQTYDPAKAAVYRKTRMAYHVEYCRQPAVKAKKKTYDRLHRAKRDYGPLWEVKLLQLDIRAAVLERNTDYDIRLAKGGLSKSQKRKRAYDQSRRNSPHREVPQVGPLGNLASRQGRQDGGRAG